MHLIQLLLPLKPGADAAIARTRDELLEVSQGVTAYLRSPARGAWIAPGGRQADDDVIMVEVVVPTLDREWWRRYRATLEARFDEEQIHIRTLPTEIV